MDYYEYDPYCFVCERRTDHFAEHDDLVEAGLAEYQNNYVLRTEAYTFEKAREVMGF